MEVPEGTAGVFSPPEAASTHGLKHVFRGLEAGVVGGIAMLAFSAAASMWRRHVWYENANLLGSTFYGNQALYSGAGWITISGIALRVLITGIWGAVTAPLLNLSWSTGYQRGTKEAGGLFAAGVLWLLEAAIWNRTNPLIPLYSSAGATVFAFILLGLCLGHREARPSPPPLPAMLPEPEAESAPNALE